MGIVNYASNLFHERIVDSLKSFEKPRKTILSTQQAHSNLPNLLFFFYSGIVHFEVFPILINFVDTS